MRRLCARWLLCAALALAAACGASSRATAADPGAGSGPPVSLVLEAVDGGEVDLAAYRGRVVVLHLFATWALGAHGDADQLAAAHERRAGEVVVVGVALDPEGWAFVAPWRRAVGARYLIALADDRVRAGQTGLGRIHEVPTTVVLDRGGRPVVRLERALAPDELETILDRLVPPDRGQ